jgi:predicted Zn finger-like uncharacterized protein
MLITTCSHCGARFRVTPQQLNVRQGQVRCGSCQAVFNGFEALERHPDDDTGSRLLAAREAAELAAQLESQRPQPTQPEASPEASGEVETLDDSQEIPAAPVEETSSAPETAARPRRMSRPDLTLPPPPVAKPPARARWFGVALLALALAAEAAYAYRGPIAQRYPVLRPLLESACAGMGCAVGPRGSRVARPRPRPASSPPSHNSTPPHPPWGARAGSRVRSLCLDSTR